MQLAAHNRGTRHQTAAFNRFHFLLALVGVSILGWLWWHYRKTPAPKATGSVPVQTKSSTAARRAVGVTNAVRSNTVPASLFSQRILEAQLALVRQGISPGSLDGVMGSQTRAAMRVFQQKENLPVTGQLDAATRLRLSLSDPPYAICVITSDDLARLLPLGKTWLARSQQERLDYETVLEMVAERSQAHPNLIRLLNSGVNWSNMVAGTQVTVPNAEFPPARGRAALARIFLASRMLEAYDAETNLLAHFPCSIAQRVDKRPVGELHVAVVAPDPNYTFDPEVFPESAEARELGRKLILQPGPNNPVGVVWIGLDKAGYGIHGTPRPEEVGRTESHGCFRLANWNAEYLMKLTWVGMPVFVEP